jgi:glycosyltransferase involved in cell wall biosynthesis
MPLNVLVVDRSPPVSLTRGNSLIGRHVFGRLAGRYRLTFLSPADPARLAEDRVMLEDVFDRVHLVPAGQPISAIGGWLGGEVAMRAPTLAPSDARRFAAAVTSLAEEERFDVIHVRQLPMAPFGRAFEPTPRLLELVDSESLGAARSLDAAMGSGAARATTLRLRARTIAARFAETHAARGYDLITAVADADAAAIRSGAPGTSVEVIPNGVDAHQFAPLDVLEEPATLVFVGAMDFPPNVAAARFLVERVLPRVRTAGVTVRLVGRSPVAAVRELERHPAVEVTGAVEDVRPYLAAATLVVCPMVSGSGIKNKVLEALAMARPVVATPLAVEGIDRSEDDVRSILAVGADEAALAAEIDRLLADPETRQSMGRDGRALVLSRYTWDACADAYAGLYERLAAVEAGAPTPSEARSGTASTAAR